METWVRLVLIQTHQKEQHAAATCFHSAAQLTSYMVWSHVNVCAGSRRGVIIWLGQKITCHPFGHCHWLHVLSPFMSNRIFNLKLNKQKGGGEDVKRTRGGEDEKNDVAKWQRNENGLTCEDGHEIKTGEKSVRTRQWWTNEEKGEDREVEESITGDGRGGEGKLNRKLISRDGWWWGRRREMRADVWGSDQGCGWWSRKE